MRSTTSSSTPKRVDHVSFPRPAAGSVSATALRTHRAGRAHPRPRGPAGAARRLGPPSAGPGRTCVHRPARPRGTGAALVQPRLDAARGDGAGRIGGGRDRRAGDRPGGTPTRAVPRREPGLAGGRGPRHRSPDRGPRADPEHSGGAQGEGGAGGRGAPPQAPRARPPSPGAAAEPDPPPPAPAAGAPHARPISTSSRSRRRS